MPLCVYVGFRYEIYLIKPTVLCRKTIDVMHEGTEIINVAPRPLCLNNTPEKRYSDIFAAGTVMQMNRHKYRTVQTNTMFYVVPVVLQFLQKTTTELNM